MGSKRTTIVKSPADIEIYARSGIVHGSKTWASTQVHSSGGGGHIGPYGGHVQAARVSSSNTTHNAFFLVEEGGQEVEIALSDVQFGVRDGHHVTAIYAGHQKDDSCWLTCLHNHNTEKSATIQSAYRKIRGGRSIALFLGATTLAITLGSLAQTWTLLLVILAAYAGYTLFVESPKLKALDQEIDRQARELIGASTRIVTSTTGALP